MTGKRQFGNVRKLPSGRWQARYRTVDGRLASVSRTFKTKRDAARVGFQASRPTRPAVCGSTRRRVGFGSPTTRLHG